MATNPMDEDALIAEIFAPLATAEGADGLADDAAIFAGGGGDVVVSCDALAAGVHFFAEDPPDAIAQKALRVNLSDLAAKGAEPFAYLLTLALGPGASTPWVRGFADGLRMDNALYGVDLLGGDTLRASPGGGTTVAITAFGRVPEGKVVRRRTARPGEVIAVTGVVGDAALGLRCRLEDDPFSLSADHREALLARYLLPEPPVAAWPAVRAHASAAMDVSDGLLGDLLKLASAAGVAAIIDIERVPHSPAVRAALASGPRARDLALTGGDDYQVLATMPAHAFTAFRDDCARDGAAATVIGEIKAGAPAVTVRDRGTTITVDDSRFQHF